MRTVLTILCLIVLSGAALAQQHMHASNYATMKARSIKALSDEQIEQLRDGKGMGLSLPAELNSYPGPVHALDMRDALALTPEQERKIAAIYEVMAVDAKALGRRIIVAEGTLDQLFATASAKPDEVMTLLKEIAALNGRLRAVHILAHMETREILDHNQIALYDRERGYGSTSAGPTQHQH